MNEHRPSRRLCLTGLCITTERFLFYVTMFVFCIYSYSNSKLSILYNLFVTAIYNSTVPKDVLKFNVNQFFDSLIWRNRDIDRIYFLLNFILCMPKRNFNQVVSSVMRFFPFDPQKYFATGNLTLLIHWVANKKILLV